MWKLNWKKDKDKLVVLLLIGLIFLIMEMPLGKKSSISQNQSQIQNQELSSGSNMGTAQGQSGDSYSYEKRMEKRLKEILEKVEGVGKVEVMLVLRSSEEKVWHMDVQNSTSITEESQTDGTGKKSQETEEKKETVLIGSGEKAEPVIEKEIYPQIEGIVILAQGAEDAKIKAEISETAEALFGVPAHKIKVLKRVQ